MFEIERIQSQPTQAIQAKEPLFCVDFDAGRRIYATIGAITNPLETFSGVTDVTQDNSGDKGFLTHWYDQQAKVAVVKLETDTETEIRTIEKREYGTIWHALIPGIVNQGCQVSPADIEQEINGFLIRRNLWKYNGLEWAFRAKKNLLSFVTWVAEEGIQFLATELAVVLREAVGDETLTYLKGGEFVTETLTVKRPFRMATRIDAVCRDKKGRLLIVDWKTGMHSYANNEAYVYQLGYNELAFRVNYPEFANEEIFLYNWSPKDWTGDKPTYHYTPQPRTSFAQLASMAAKFWSRREASFLTGTELTIPENVFRPGMTTHIRKTYYEIIQEELTKIQKGEQP